MRMRPVLAVLVLGACGFEIAQSGPGGANDARVDASIDGRVDAASDARPDARPDAPPDAPPAWVALESLMVPCSGTPVTSTTVLQTTGTYRLRATGTCVANSANGSQADAEYLGWNVGPTYDSYNSVDNGLAVNDLDAQAAAKNPRWGGYTNTHEYVQPWTGTGAVIMVSFHETNLGNNTGSLSVTIEALQ